MTARCMSLGVPVERAVVRYLAARVAVIYVGKPCEGGSADELFAPPTVRETEPSPARKAAAGHVIVCHISLEELRRVPSVIKDRPAAAAPPGGS